MLSRKLRFMALAGLLTLGCRAWPYAAPLLPQANVLVREQLVVHSDFALPQHHRLVDELAALRGDLSTRLALPVSDEPIHVYLFDTADRYQAFMRLRHPELPSRRAFFFESDTRLEVYAHWGDRVAEDLRHETAHGYLHAVAPNLPLWLDEGLAEYFEVPRGRGGLNPPHVAELYAALQAGAWRPDLFRLEQWSSGHEMTQRDYAESWAWVHFLLETEPARRDLLRGYLQSLRAQATAEPLSSQLRQGVPHPEQALIDHVAYLATRPSL
jgi:hypothetical protein